MKRTRYKVNGAEVCGYRIGPCLAIRDKTADYPVEDKQSRTLETDAGKWVLEHVQTGTELYRGWYLADVVAIARLATEGE